MPSTCTRFFKLLASQNLEINLDFISLHKDVASGESVLFAPRLPAAYAVWLGEIKPLSYFKVISPRKVVYLLSYSNDHKPMNLFITCLQEIYKVSKVFYTDEIVNVLLDLYKGMGNPFLFLLHGLNTDSNNFSKPAEFQVPTSSLFWLELFASALKQLRITFSIITIVATIKLYRHERCYHLCAQAKCMKMKGMNSATRKPLHNSDYILMKNCTFGKLLSIHFTIRLLFCFWVKQNLLSIYPAKILAQLYTY